MKYLFLILYLIAAALNLTATKLSKVKLFAITKPMLLLLLGLYVVFYGLPEPDILLVCALASCWAGDVLLMLKGEGWFVAGGISFFAGHVLLIFGFARYVDFSVLPLSVIIPAAVFYASMSCSVMLRAGKEAPKLMQIPMFLYLLCNSVTNLFALSRLLEQPGVWQGVSYAGALLFFLSDCVLYLYRYDTEKKLFFKNEFCVMLTYITGILFVTLGFAPVVL